MLTDHKQALIQSSCARGDIKLLQLSTYGIFFMGTPHQGESEVRFGELMRNAESLFKDPGWLQMQLGQYAQISNYFDTKLGFETEATPIATGGAIMASILYFPQASY